MCTYGARQSTGLQCQSIDQLRKVNNKSSCFVLHRRCTYVDIAAGYRRVPQGTAGYRRVPQDFVDKALVGFAISFFVNSVDIDCISKEVDNLWAEADWKEAYWGAKCFEENRNILLLIVVLLILSLTLFYQFVSISLILLLSIDYWYAAFAEKNFCFVIPGYARGRLKESSTFRFLGELTLHGPLSFFHGVLCQRSWHQQGLQPLLRTRVADLLIVSAVLARLILFFSIVCAISFADSKKDHRLQVNPGWCN